MVPLDTGQHAVLSTCEVTDCEDPRRNLTNKCNNRVSFYKKNCGGVSLSEVIHEKLFFINFRKEIRKLKFGGLAVRQNVSDEGGTKRQRSKGQLNFIN